MDTPFLSDPAFTFAFALAAGMIAQTTAHHLQIPGIVLFLLTGVVLGPDVVGIIRPETLGHGLELLIGLAVAVILFEGGLNLEIGRLRREATTIRRLITVGSLITALGGALAVHLIMGWDWRTAVLFGTLVIVTGPTVIAPLVRRIRVTRNLQTILEGEGVLIDPVGAVVAVVALETVLARSATSAAASLVGIPSRLLVGLAIGVVGGFVIGLLLRARKVVPEELQNVFTLALVLAFFELSNAILPESGIMQAAVAGLVVGNMGTRLHRELKEFKEQLTVMLVGMLFVILAADVRIAEVTSLGWPAMATILVLIFVVRPINVAASTLGSTLSWRERFFIAWLSPRGIVAAAVASLFAQRLAEEGVAGGTELRAMVFLVIAVTVFLQGATGGLVASWLGVRRPRDQGWVIVGAHPLSRALARALGVTGQEVVLVDTNAKEVTAAEEEGLRVIFGNANETGILLRADVEGRRGLLVATQNDGLNLLIADHARSVFRLASSKVAVARGRGGVRRSAVHRSGHTVLYARELDMEPWDHHLLQGTAKITRWKASDRVVEGEAAGSATAGELLGGSQWSGLQFVPLVRIRDGDAVPVDDELTIAPGDVVELLLFEDQEARIRARLSELGWERAEAADEPIER